jgi:Tol biopolymer transport system component
MLAWRLIGVAICVAWCMSPGSVRALQTDIEPSILAPVLHQVGWLNLEAPRAQLITRFEPADFVTDVAVRPDGAVAAVAVMHTPPAGSAAASDILALDLNSLQLSPLVPGRDPNESLSAPQWSPDGSRVFFQSENISVIGTSYGGGATVQYPSRIEAVAADGSAPSMLVDNARQPACSPDGSLLAFVRRVDDGPTLVLHSLLGTSERTLISPGHFTDIVSPRFSPQGDRIAFMAPVTSQGESDRLFFAPLRLALPTLAKHGVAWDLWTEASDGTGGPVRLASLSADDGTVSWSPDGTRLFVYGGTGSFFVDGATGEVTNLSYIAGYGSTSWVTNR